MSNLEQAPVPPGQNLPAPPTAPHAAPYATPHGAPYAAPPAPSAAPAAIPPGTSGLAVAGLVLAFLLAPVGLVLSLVALTRTGAGRAKGRGLAVAGIVVSLLISAAATAGVIAVARSTVVDPGCVSGKQAIIDGASRLDQASLRATAARLEAAAAKARHDDVRAAMTAVAGDYTQLADAMTTGALPAGIQGKVAADAARIDQLCTVGA